MRALLFFLGVAAALAGAGSAPATTVILSAATGEAFNSGSGFTTLALSPNPMLDVSLRSNNSSLFRDEKRGILEFSVASIPAGATITAATLALRVQSQSNPAPPIDIFAFVGDGTPQLADLTAVPPTPLFDNQLLAAPATNQFSSAALAAFVQSLVASPASDAAGFVLLVDHYPLGRNQGDKASLRTDSTPQWSPPQLIVDYDLPVGSGPAELVPEPASVAAWVALLLVAAAATARTSRSVVRNPVLLTRRREEPRTPHAPS